MFTYPYIQSSSICVRLMVLDGSQLYPTVSQNFSISLLSKIPSMIGLGLNRSRWPLDHYIEVEVFNRAFDKDMFVEILRIVKKSKNWENSNSRISRSQVPNWVSSSCSIKSELTYPFFKMPARNILLKCYACNPFKVSESLFFNINSYFIFWAFSN